MTWATLLSRIGILWMDLLPQRSIKSRDHTLEREVMMLRNATKTLARRALPTTAGVAKAERSAESQALQVLARRANSRSIATSRARLNAEKVSLDLFLRWFNG